MMHFLYISGLFFLNKLNIDFLKNTSKFLEYAWLKLKLEVSPVIMQSSNQSAGPQPSHLPASHVTDNGSAHAAAEQVGLYSNPRFKVGGVAL